MPDMNGNSLIAFTVDLSICELPCCLKSGYLLLIAHIKLPV